MIVLRRTVAEDPDFCGLLELLDGEPWKRYPETQQNYTAGNVIKMDTKAIVAYLNSPLDAAAFGKRKSSERSN